MQKTARQKFKKGDRVVSTSGILGVVAGFVRADRHKVKVLVDGTELPIVTSAYKWDTAPVSEVASYPMEEIPELAEWGEDVDLDCLYEIDPIDDSNCLVGDVPVDFRQLEQSWQEHAMEGIKKAFNWLKSKLSR